MDNNFIGWSRDKLVDEVIRLRREIIRLSDQVNRYYPVAEEHWREEERKRGEQGIFG